MARNRRLQTVNHHPDSLVEGMTYTVTYRKAASNTLQYVIEGLFKGLLFRAAGVRDRYCQLQFVEAEEGLLMAVAWRRIISVEEAVKAPKQL